MSTVVLDEGVAVSIRYIGSKARIASEIGSLLGPWQGRGRFVDVFCGTGAVSRVAADLGWPLVVNDHLVSSAATAVAQIVAADDVPFTAIGGYQQTIERLNRARPVRGFIWQEYSPASRSRIGLERRYFTESNAARIDGIRVEIEHLKRSGDISVEELRLLLADLIGSANRVANIAGTYGCFLRDWSATSKRDLVLTPRVLRRTPVPFEVHLVDVFDLTTLPEDTLYLDPPYTKRQYAAYYHICETIAEGDRPVVSGITGLRPWEDKASTFCYKNQALRALVSLLTNLDYDKAFLSYSNQGHVPLDSLLSSLAQIGDISDHGIASIGRYRPNEQASANATAVLEHLLEIQPLRQRALSPGSKLAV